MQKMSLLLTTLLLTACQVVVKSPDGSTTSYGPKLPLFAAASTPPAQTMPALSPQTSNIRSGLYSQQRQNKRKDGKGKLQNESARYRYLIEDAGNGRLLVQYIGEASAADPGGMGGLIGGAAESAGIASLDKGVWQWRSKDDDGPCGGRFLLDNNSLKHLSGRCQGAGNSDEMAWPAGNTTLNFVRPLQAGERQQLQTLTGLMVRQPVTAAQQKPAAPASLVGQTFAAMQLPYQRFGFDNYNSRLDPMAFSEMPEGRVTVYPLRKGKARYVLIATPASSGQERVLEVREAAVGSQNLRFVAANPEGDLVTLCTLDGKPVSQVFAFARPQGRSQFIATASGKGENIWLVQPGGTRIIALGRGEKLLCRSSSLGG